MWKNKDTQNEAIRRITEIITHNASSTNTRPCASEVNNDGDLLTAINKLSNKLTSIEGSMSVLLDKVDNLDKVQKRSGFALNPDTIPASVQGYKGMPFTRTQSLPLPVQVRVHVRSLLTWIQLLPLSHQVKIE